jgi:hypothetical protein
MSLEDARQLWAEHLAAPSRKVSPGKIDGIDLVILDANIAGYVSSWAAG